MYVCVCNAVTDRAILKAIDAGAHSLDSLVDELAVTTACGSCEQAVRDHLASRLAALGHADWLEPAMA
ncbi:bacterioferritin-associated ferredoxin [Natronospira proteinivora]|uniref:Bacterioferritin-associated ferredoxin n=1 Tax=Natronospira proteinivora TaxID=1807133 RepID=A0ABT1GDP0_9GAMM|nr:(2Fe-2S)-binding protein [Natronospira proteinivora]MCP1728478.1 bacterioferritin-associated ferredoxin [Natronospira proteinivora]